MVLKNLRESVLRRNWRSYLMDYNHCRLQESLRGRDSVCWGGGNCWGGDFGRRHYREWICSFRHQKKRPSSKRRDPAQCPGQGYTVNTVLLRSTPLWKQWLKDTVLVWAQLQGVWDTCTDFHQGTYLRVCISFLHDIPPILIHNVVALAFQWELSFDVLWAKDWLQVEPRALTVQPLL